MMICSTEPRSDRITSSGSSSSSRRLPIRFWFFQIFPFLETRIRWVAEWGVSSLTAHPWHLYVPRWLPWPPFLFAQSATLLSSKLKSSIFSAFSSSSLPSSALWFRFLAAFFVRVQASLSSIVVSVKVHFTVQRFFAALVAPMAVTLHGFWLPKFTLFWLSPPLSWNLTSLQSWFLSLTAFDFSKGI